MSTLTKSESVREKNADDDPTKPFWKSSREISCKLERFDAFEYFIATNIPTEMAIKQSTAVTKNLARFSFKVLEIENLNPLTNEWDLYDLNIYYFINSAKI